MQRAGITESSISSQLSGLSLVPGIRELIESSHERGFEIIVLSDNLTLFVEKFLESTGLRQERVRVFMKKFMLIKFLYFDNRSGEPDKADDQCTKVIILKRINSLKTFNFFQKIFSRNFGSSCKI